MKSLRNGKCVNKYKQLHFFLFRHLDCFQNQNLKTTKQSSEYVIENEGFDNKAEL